MSLLLVENEHNDHPLPFDKLFGCYADYSSQCGPSMPYICSSGLMKGSCSSDPKIWQESRMCNSFCDTRNRPTNDLYPSFLPVQDRSKQAECPIMLINTCPLSLPYMCIDGIDSSGCSANKYSWQNNSSCKEYVDTRPLIKKN